MNKDKINRHLIKFGLLLLAFTSLADLANAHGEKAQQAALRTRTLNWIDTEIYPRNAAVNDIVTVKGKFIPSENWPRHLNSIEETSFLNIGVPGPSFIRLDSKVNGTTMIRSTSFQLGKVYEYEVTLKARTPGRYHVHPVISVKGTRPLIGPAYWVEITGDQANCTNTIETLSGKVIDLETYGMKQSIGLHAFWLIAGLAWIGYWFRNFRKQPVIMPRFNQIEKLGNENADDVIQRSDIIAGGVVISLVLVLVAVGYFMTQIQVPQTIPLQTGLVKVKHIDNPSDGLLDIEIKKANYRIPGRSFSVDMTITNNTDRDFRIGEFTTANVRFINSKVKIVKPQDSHDLVAADSLIVENNIIPAGQTVVIKMHADDALWETQRLTSLVYDPDSFFAGLLFLYDDQGNRLFKEISGLIIPTFV